MLMLWLIMVHNSVGLMEIVMIKFDDLEYAVGVLIKVMMI
jgi:hypothetical protein